MTQRKENVQIRVPTLSVLLLFQSWEGRLCPSLMSPLTRDRGTKTNDFQNPRALALTVVTPWPFCPQLIDRVYKGIPMNIRGQVWSVLLNIQEVKSKNPRTYKVRSAGARQTGQAVSGAQVSSWRERQPCSGSRGPSRVLGTDGNVGTGGKLGLVPFPGFRKKPNKEHFAE